MKATVLIDNIAHNDCCGEWGLSVFIEHEGKNILLDTGASGKFAKNAEKLGIDLRAVDYGVLSHAHYDHSDGMKDFFALNDKAYFYLQEDCKEKCFGRRFIFIKYIGIKKAILKNFDDRIKYINGKAELCKNAYLLPHTTESLESIGKKAGMLITSNGRLTHDSFSHEQSLVLRTEKGLVIFNSCSHGGADNIINEVGEVFPQEKIHALIGGFHLYRSDEEEVRALARRIKDTGIEKIYTGHCTGNKAFDILKEILGEGAAQLKVGLEIEI